LKNAFDFVHHFHDANNFSLPVPDGNAQNGSRLKTGAVINALIETGISVGVGDVENVSGLGDVTRKSQRRGKTNFGDENSLGYF